MIYKEINLNDELINCLSNKEPGEDKTRLRTLAKNYNIIDITVVQDELSVDIPSGRVKIRGRVLKAIAESENKKVTIRWEENDKVINIIEN